MYKNGENMEVVAYKYDDWARSVMDRMVYVRGTAEDRTITFNYV